jgi:adenosine deaminase
MDTVELVEELRKTTTVIVGIDLSGNPNKGKFVDFVAVLESARRYGLKTTLHAAEVPEDDATPDAETELAQILKFKPDRLGHVLYLRDYHVALVILDAAAVLHSC